ncbi:MAG: PIN domain-containing protein [Bacteroidia bacterium]|nr:PIN domain-containing protein [Bacteroidia bacterium]
MQTYHPGRLEYKLKRISKLSDKQLQESLFRLLTKIHFVNEELIPERIWLKAEKLTRDIDIDDLDFVALTDYLKGMLWTGDQELYDGLKNGGFKKVVNTQDLLRLRALLSKK